MAPASTSSRLSSAAWSVPVARASVPPWNRTSTGCESPAALEPAVL